MAKGLRLRMLTLAAFCGAAASGTVIGCGGSSNVPDLSNHGGPDGSGSADGSGGADGSGDDGAMTGKPEGSASDDSGGNESSVDGAFASDGAAGDGTTGDAAGPDVAAADSAGGDGSDSGTTTVTDAGGEEEGSFPGVDGAPEASPPDAAGAGDAISPDDAGPGDASLADATLPEAASPDATTSDSASPGDSTVSDGGGSVDAADDLSVAEASPVDGAADASGSDGPDDASCNQPQSDAVASCLVQCNTAPVVPIVVSTQPVPPYTGGPVVPGLYYLTAITDYYPADSGVEAGTATETIQETEIIGAPTPVGMFQSVRSRDGRPNETQSYQFAIAGNSLDVTEVCPNPGQLAIPYTTASGQVVVDVPQGGDHVEQEVFTLQTPFEAGAPDEAGVADAGCGQTQTDAHAACNSVCNQAPAVAAIGVTGTAPVPTGGAIVDGTYYVTARTLWGDADAGYDGGTIFTSSETVVITTSNGVSIWDDIASTASGTSEDTSTLSVVASGTDLLITALCPVAEQASRGYFVSGNDIHMLVPSNGVMVESVLTKQ